MKIIYKKITYLILIVGTFLILLWLSFVFDNKYSMKMPFGQEGVISITQEDFNRNTPIYLIDGWEFYNGIILPTEVDSLTSKITYIGEYSNFDQNENSLKKREGTYRLVVNYLGEDSIIDLNIPYIYTNYQLWWNGELLETGKNSIQTKLYLKEGRNEIIINISATHGYYSGMYFPGSISTDNTLDKTKHIQTAIYGIAFLCPITLALFSILLWNRTKEKLRFHFGMLCLSYALYVSHYFVQLWNLPIGEYWYLTQDLALYSIVYFAINTTLLASGLVNKKVQKISLIITIVFPVIELVFCLFLFPKEIESHGVLQNIYRMISSILLLLGSISIIKSNLWENFFILSGNIMLGIGLIINSLFANLFEPIVGLWQFEWSGLFMTLLFGVTMVVQNEKLLLENDAYESQLESMVEDRTRELSQLIEERRRFFSDMAHDLKAPIFSMKTFMEMIRHHGVGIDKELEYYIDQIEQKQGIISKRVQGLNELNLVDKITDPKEFLLVDELLGELENMYQPDAAVREVYLTSITVEEKLVVYIQREKLMIVFENLLYNAMCATGIGGTITISANKVDNMVSIKIQDTGCGIPEEELPLIFNRFFVGNNNKDQGSGLGLYIVKSIIEENEGKISAVSIKEEGSIFEILLPFKKIKNET